MLQSILNLIILSVFVFREVAGGKLRCSETLSTGERVSFCCDNHEEDENGTCIECSIGYFSEMGKSCQICFPGRYGRKCSDFCRCNYQRCHHVLGCIELSSIGETSSELQDREENVIIPIGTHSSLNISGSIHTKKSAFTFLGLQKREVIVYSICIGLLSFGLLFCTFLIRRYRHRHTIIRINNTDNIQRQDNPTIEQVANDSSENVENAYEMIDERNLVTDNPLNENDQTSDHTSEGSSPVDTGPLPNDDYLNPYQPMVEVVENHEYSRTHDTGDTDSSESNGENKSSQYLNPYQPMVSDSDRHEYCKAQQDFPDSEKDKIVVTTGQNSDAYTDAHSFRPTHAIELEGNENECMDLKLQCSTDICTRNLNFPGDI